MPALSSYFFQNTSVPNVMIRFGNTWTIKLTRFLWICLMAMARGSPSDIFHRTYSSKLAIGFSSISNINIHRIFFTIVSKCAGMKFSDSHDITPLKYLLNWLNGPLVLLTQKIPCTCKLFIWDKLINILGFKKGKDDNRRI